MDTSDHPESMRWLVIGVLTIATAGMFVVSMRANYLYGYGIGQSEETKRAIAWANVGADIWKGFGLIVVVTLWRKAVAASGSSGITDVARVSCLQCEFGDRHLCSRTDRTDERTGSETRVLCRWGQRTGRD